MDNSSIIGELSMLLLLIKELTQFSYFSQQLLLINCRTAVVPDIRHPQLIPEMNIDLWYELTKNDK